jgi:hypothetical protein
MANVPIRRIAPVGVLESLSQRIGAARHHHQMNMIRHETIADQRELTQLGITP